MKFSLFLTAIVITVIGHFFRVKRLNLILDKYIPRDLQYKSLAAGYVINAFFPIRLGELIRALVLSGFNIRNFLNAASSIIIERALDAIAIASSAALLFFWISEETNTLNTIFVPYFILVIFFLSLLIVVITRPNKLKLRIFLLIKLLPRSLSLNILRLLFNIVQNLKHMILARNLYKVLFYTLGMWIFYFIAYIFLVLSLGFEIAEGLTQVLTHLFTFEIIEKTPSKIYSSTLFLVYLIVPAISLLGLSRIINYFQTRSNPQFIQLTLSDKLTFANSLVEFEFYSSYFKSKKKDFYLIYKEIFENCEIVKDESGASGAVTSVIEKGGKTLYRKYSFGTNVSNLSIQLDFLIKSHVGEFVKIVEFKKSDAFVYYDMEYKNNCLPLSQAVSLLNYEDVFDTVDRILFLVESKGTLKLNSKNDLEYYIENKFQKNLLIWLDYISELNIDIHLPLTINGIVYPSVENTYNSVSVFDFNSYFREDLGLFFHGDLTLENIIWDPDLEQKFYLIDPNIGSRYCSYESEVAKIYQSIEFNYENLQKFQSSKLNRNEFTLQGEKNLRYVEIQHYLDSKFEKSRSKTSLVSIKMHTLIHLLRVLPYINNTGISKDVLVIQIFLGLRRRINQID
jgi:hypothetical protein